MALVDPSYPDNVWDGLSKNIDRNSRLQNVDPDSRDYDQVAAEIIAIEESLDDTKTKTVVESQTVTSNTTLEAFTEFVLVNASSGSVTITLPDAAAADGCTKEIKKIDESAYSVVVVPAGSDTIDGETELTIAYQWTTLTVQSVEGAWYIR